MDKFTYFFKKNKKEVLIFLLFFLVAVVSVLYSLTLPFTIHGDTYVTLLANKVAADPSFPDRQILLNLDFKPYLYTNLLAFLGNYFSLFTYKMILLFLLVLSTGYAAYLALRMLGFSMGVSLLTALVALMPRVGAGGEAFGVIATDDVLGRTLGLPFLWLLTAWFIKIKQDKKPFWPLFIVSGLCTYIHPVSMIFFNGLLFVIMIYWILSDKNYRSGIKDFFYSVITFSLSASLLLTKIFFVTKGIALVKSGFAIATTKEYADALLYRVGWDFLPGSAVYLVHFLIINFIFIVVAIYVFRCIKQGRLVKGEILYLISEFSFIIIGLSVFLSFFLPNIQFWLLSHFDFPFILQQTSRFFKYYYLGIYLLWAVAMTLFFRDQIENKKFYFVAFLIVGVMSSTFGFEVFQYVIGFHGYKKEYIPNFLQEQKLPDDREVFPIICKNLDAVGITSKDLVITDEFQLRYYCNLKELTTFEEGSIYFMLGRNELVWWFRLYKEQEHALYRGNALELISFAKKVGAGYALVQSDSPSIKEFETKKMVISRVQNLVVIKFNQ